MARKNVVCCVLAALVIAVLLSTEAFALTAEADSPMMPLFQKGEGEFYNYAPCMVQVDATTKYVYYCSNRTSGVVVDYICWRKATLENNEWAWGNEHVAFGPSSSGWDRCHVCDPDIVKGRFQYGGHTYTWAMTYLGVAQWDCNANEIGIAFADSIEGPWIKFASNPIISAPNTTSWGVGQDTMVSIDRAGRFRVVYRYSDGTDDYCRYKDFDFSVAENYSETPAQDVTRQGLLDGVSHTCPSHVIYDAARESYYIAAEHIWDEQKRSCRETMIASLAKEDFESGSGTWEVLYKYNRGNTGYASNHNASFCRDPYGYNISSNQLTVVMSSGEDAGLWTFKINEGSLLLADQHASASFTTGRIYKLVNKESGLVLDNWYSDNGAACYAYEWTGVFNQQWVFTKLGVNDYKLINRWTGKALDNYGNSTPDITYIWDDVSATDQHWEICYVDSKYCYVKNIDTGRALTCSGSTNGTGIVAVPYTGLDSQKWEIIDCGKLDAAATAITSGQVYKIVNRATGDVLDNWNTENGAPCYSYVWTGVENQKWAVVQISNGVYSIRNQKAGQALDCYDTTDNATAYIWDYVSGTDQQWRITSLGNGFFKITNVKSGLALTQSVQGNGNSIFGYHYVGAERQQWEFVAVS